jgi:hypothetical protein
MLAYTFELRSTPILSTLTGDLILHDLNSAQTHYLKTMDNQLHCRTTRTRTIYEAIQMTDSATISLPDHSQELGDKSKRRANNLQ